jgi:CheY-like chemotaxis protein
MPASKVCVGKTGIWGLTKSLRRYGISIMTKVLYVEDNDDNVFMLKMRLELLGDFEVLTAEDGEKGCQMAAAERPDIILMDLEMPVVDGWEATRRLKAIHKPATFPLSRSPPTRSPVNAKRRSRQDATSSTPSRSNSIGWSKPFDAFLPTANDGNP